MKRKDCEECGGSLEGSSPKAQAIAVSEPQTPSTRVEGGCERPSCIRAPRPASVSPTSSPLPAAWAVRSPMPPESPWEFSSMHGSAPCATQPTEEPCTPRASSCVASIFTPEKPRRQPVCAWHCATASPRHPSSVGGASSTHAGNNSSSGIAGFPFRMQTGAPHFSPLVAGSRPHGLLQHFSPGALGGCVPSTPVKRVVAVPFPIETAPIATLHAWLQQQVLSHSSERNVAGAAASDIDERPFPVPAARHAGGNVVAAEVAAATLQLPRLTDEGQTQAL